MYIRYQITYRHDIFIVRSKGNTVDAILVAGELPHAGLVLHVPDADGGEMTTFACNQVTSIFRPKIEIIKPFQ